MVVLEGERGGCVTEVVVYRDGCTTEIVELQRWLYYRDGWVIEVTKTRFCYRMSLILFLCHP